MIEIPEVLRGKEVKEFLTEYMDSSVFFRDKFYSQVSPGGYLTGIAVFLQQTFVPEMIEYFEGWEEEDKSGNGGNGIYFNSEWTIVTDEENEFRVFNFEKDYDFPYPQTLAQFLTFTHEVKKTWRQ